MMENTMKKKVIHIVATDKFTIGYVEFMRMCMMEYEHKFILLDKNNVFSMNSQFEVDESVILIRTYKELLINIKFRNLFNACDKLIISGLFGVELFLFFYGKKLWRKTYVQFWGADFYIYRDCTGNVIRYAHKCLLKICLNWSAGVINLIPDDFEELKKILNLKDLMHYVAPMPRNPKENIDYELYKEKYIHEGKCRILVGNSATEENQHVEIFKLLYNLEEKDFEVYCPLSYGNSEYKDKIIKIGTQYFEDRFIAIIDYMDKKKYIEFLYSCDIGIFNNNRQQAMGNINIMAPMGKKIYIRDDTSMWKYFKNLGYQFNTINQLKKESLQELIKMSDEQRENNMKIKNHMVENVVQYWKRILAI